MLLARPAFAADPRTFGRAVSRELDAAPVQAPSLSADVKLFAMTFLAGFVFVSVLIA